MERRDRLSFGNRSIYRDMQCTIRNLRRCTYRSVFLILVGVSLLAALTVTQVIIVFLSVFTAAGYVAAGAVRSPLVLFIGVTYTVGCIASWYMAYRVDTDRLTVALEWSLLSLAPILATEQSYCNLQLLPISILQVNYLRICSLARLFYVPNIIRWRLPLESAH